MHFGPPDVPLNPSKSLHHLQTWRNSYKYQFVCDKLKVAPKARLRAQIFIKFCILVTDTLKINPVKFFDSAPTLKIDPFPYKGITPYMERLNQSELYGVSR